MYVLDVFVAGPTLAPDPEEKTAKPASEGQILRAWDPWHPLALQCHPYRSI